MLKKKIWKRIISASCALLLETGILMGCTGQPVAAEAGINEGTQLMLVENVGWTDLENFKAELQVEAAGLENLKWKKNETEENEEALEGRVLGITQEKYIPHGGAFS